MERLFPLNKRPKATQFKIPIWCGVLFNGDFWINERRLWVVGCARTVRAALRKGFSERTDHNKLCCGQPSQQPYLSLKLPVVIDFAKMGVSPSKLVIDQYESLRPEIS